MTWEILEHVLPANLKRGCPQGKSFKVSLPLVILSRRMEFSYKLLHCVRLCDKKSLVWALRVLPLCRKGVLNQKCCLSKLLCMLQWGNEGSEISPAWVKVTQQPRSPVFWLLVPCSFGRPGSTEQIPPCLPLRIFWLPLFQAP